MARYDEVFTNLAQRAVRQGGVDFDTFASMAVTSGVSPEALMDALEADIRNRGPIFGKFLRSLTMAAQSSVSAAGRQGETIGTIKGDAELKKLMGLADGDGESVLDRAVEQADPALADQLDVASAEHLEETWICTLVNTCPRCLPLHGQSRTREEWRALGLLPELMHEGWSSDCHCRQVPRRLAQGRDELMAPLIRVREKLGDDKLPGQRKTARAISQKDLERAMSARDEALKTPEGQRVLALLGRAMEDEGN